MKLINTARARLRSEEPEGWVTSPPLRWSLLVDLVLIAGILTVILFLAFDLANAHLRVPMGYGGDGLQYSRDAKTIIQTGWVQTTDRLGAPFGQEMWDFTISGDNGNFLIMRAIAAVTGDFGLLLNIFFFLSFYLAAGTSYLCLRWLRTGRALSVLAAVLFAYSPYHLSRGAGHLLLSSYFVVAIGVLLAVRAAAGVSLLGTVSEPWVRGPQWLVRWMPAVRTAGVVVLCAAAASCGAYYAIFTMITIALASIVSAAGRRAWRPLVAGAGYVAVMGGFFVLNILPNLLDRMREGRNPLVANRQPIELDLYGLRLIQLLTPVPGHALPPLEWASTKLMEGYSSEPSQYLGSVGAVTLLVMLGWIAGRVVRGGAAPGSDVRSVLAVLTVAWVLLASTGGLEWFITLVGFTELRAWNRASILVMFLVLAWGCVTASPLVDRWLEGPRGRRVLAFGGVSALLVLGVIDQSGRLVPKMNSYAGTYESDRAFFPAVEASMPEAAMVYQLPYRRFPEEPALHGSGDYDLYRPYLQTQRLRWSYGGMKGREADWQDALDGLTAEQLVESIVSVGFEGILVDRAGYADFGQQMVGELRAIAGSDGISSADGRWTFVDLRPVAGRLRSSTDLEARRSELLDAPRVHLDGCSGREGEGEGEFNWCADEGTIRVVQPDPTDGRVLQATFVTPGGPGQISLDVDGRSTVYDVGPSPTRLDIPLPAAAEVDIAFSTTAPQVVAPGDGRQLFVQIVNPEVVVRG